MKPLSLIAFTSLILGSAQAADIRKDILSGKPETRIAAIRQLRTQPADGTYFEPLLNALSDKDFAVRNESLRTWAAIGHELYDDFRERLWEANVSDSWGVMQIQPWRDKLVQAILDNLDGSPDCRYEAARTLCALGYRVLTDYGTCGVGNYQLETVTLEAIRRHKVQIQPYILRLLGDDNPDALLNAMFLLGGDVWNVAGSHFNQYRQSSQAAFRQLAIILAARAPGETNLRLFRPLLDDPDERTKLEAQRNLFLTPAQARQLAESQTEPSIKLRIAAIGEIQEDDKLGRTLLRRLVNKTAGEIKAAILNRLIQFKESFTDPTVVHGFLTDPSDVVRVCGLEIAEAQKNFDLTPYLKAALTDPSRQLREQALVICRDQAYKELTPYIIQAVELGVDAIYLAEPDFDNPKFAPLIEACMASTNPDVRQLLAYHFTVKIGPSSRPDLLVRLARDPDSSVAWSAIDDLQELRHPRLMEVLAYHLSRQDDDFKSILIRNLQKLGTGWAQEALHHFTTDKDRMIRILAKTAEKELAEKRTKS